MSDIYLQITETPTVVTLSAPVVSGALASTVTVANTVTVALDSNSLSALENVTVTVGAAITGTVTVSNFPATQPVSIASVTIGNTVTIAGTVTANPTGTQTIAGTVTANVPLSTDEYTAATGVRVIGVGYGGGLRVQGIDPNTFSQQNLEEGGAIPVMGYSDYPLPISGTVTIGSALPAGTNRIGVVTIGAGTVTLGASTSQIGSVTASISGTVPISISSITVGNSVTIGSLPLIAGTVTANAGGGFPAVIYSGILEYIDTEGAIPVGINGALPEGTNRIGVVTIGAGTVTIGAGISQIGSVTASISNSVTIGSLPSISGTVTANTFALQGTAVTTSNFTSTTASTVLANYNATREVLTIFIEGAGNLFVSVGATCTTVQYQVRLSSGDYWEAPNHQSTITHSAVFATAGTARVTQVS